MRKDKKQKINLISNYVFASAEVALALAFGVITVCWLTETLKSPDVPSIMLSVVGDIATVYCVCLAYDSIRDIAKQKKGNRQY